jgi:hypothetical protein
LPETLGVLVKYGNVPDVREKKDEIYTIISDPDFVAYLKKLLKDAELEFDNMQLIPMIVADMVSISNRYKSENPDAEVADLSNLVSVSKFILKKKIKKMVKAGIDENLAFDVLSVIPNPKVLSKSQYFHIRSLFNVLYEHAKSKEIDFSKLMKVLMKDGEQYIPSIISFALLERKEKVGGFNESQKKLFNDITEYCFRTMEGMKADDIRAILKAYCDTRKKDEAQNRDSNRRYYISSLPESDYPHITKAVEKMVAQNENLKKYF